MLLQILFDVQLVDLCPFDMQSAHPWPMPSTTQSRNFETFKETKNQFQRTKFRQAL